MAIVRRDERLAAENLVIAAEIGFLRWVLVIFFDANEMPCVLREAVYQLRAYRFASL